MKSRAHWVPSTQSALRRGRQRRPSLVAARDYQSRRKIDRVLAPKKRWVALEQSPQADTSSQPLIVEQKGGTRGSVCPDDPLITVHGKQHLWLAIFERRNRDDPFSTKAVPEKSACHRARGRCREGTSQRMRSFRELGIDRRHIQDRHQSSVDVKDGCTGTAQVDVPRSKMLASVDGDRPLFGDAGANAVGAFDRLGPHAAEPSPPIPEAARIGIIAAVLDRDTGGVTEQDGVSGLANHSVQPIDFLLRTDDELVERFAKVVDLVRQKDARRLAIERIDAMLGRRPPPRSRYRLDADRRRVALRNRIDVLSVLCGRVA